MTAAIASPCFMEVDGFLLARGAAFEGSAENSSAQALTSFPFLRLYVRPVVTITGRGTEARSMETDLAITTQERPQHAMARREAADPLAEILKANSRSTPAAPIVMTWATCWHSWKRAPPSPGAG
jgi:hypothetical protein